MPVEYRYRGRNISSSEIAFLRQFIADHPDLSRYALSRQLCELWQWKQTNGALRDMVCRGLLLLLDRAGEIQLPPTRCRFARNCTNRPELIAADNRPVRGSLRELLPLDFQQVRRTAQEPLFDSLVEQYHYLRYQQPVGEHLKYLVFAKGQAIACLAWSSAVRHLASRDRFIGWSTEVRKRNLRLLAYNSRFLILPSVTVRIWPRTFWVAWQSWCRVMGRRCMRILFIGWKRSSIRHASKAPVIARRTGWYWGARPDAARMRPARSRDSQSRKCWRCR